MTSKRSRSDICLTALELALQQWMVPDLGWQPSHLLERLPIVRQELTDCGFSNYSSDLVTDLSVISCFQEGLDQIYQAAQEEFPVLTSVSIHTCIIL